MTTVALTANAASASISTLSSGSHSISAVYSGDANVNVSTSGTLAESVAKALTHTSVAGSPNPAPFGANVTFTATITPAGGGSASGTVLFRLGTIPVGTVAVVGNVASLSTSSLLQGTNVIKANYSGNANFQISAASTNEVVKAATTTAITSSNSSITYGDSVTLQATVTGGTPTNAEKVTFKNGSATLGTVGLNGGVATLTTSSLPVGNLNLSAVYVGDSFNSTSAGSTSETVGNAATSVSLSSAQAAPGQAITLTATVSANSGSAISIGTVTFKEGTKTLGTAKLVGGAANMSLRLLRGLIPSR